LGTFLKLKKGQYRNPGRLECITGRRIEEKDQSYDTPASGMAIHQGDHLHPAPFNVHFPRHVLQGELSALFGAERQILELIIDGHIVIQIVVTSLRCEV
jgi:hypothetical protein